MDNLQSIIEHAWDNKDDALQDPNVKTTIHQVLNGIDNGDYRVCTKKDGEWIVHDWLKKVILLSFRTRPQVESSAGVFKYFDKVPLKTQEWTAEEFQKSQARFVPGAIVRHGAYIGKDTVLMPSFVNIGAYVGDHTMVDTWSTIGSCAQVGSHCHISGGVGIGGVLEPLQAKPVIIEDNCFIGARSEIAEGVIVEEGSVISMGVFIGASTKIVDRESGQIYQGRVPAYSVVVPGSMPSKGGVNLSCAVIVKRVDERTRSKTSINELLRL